MTFSAPVPKYILGLVCEALIQYRTIPQIRMNTRTLVCINNTKCCFIDRFEGKCPYASDKLKELITVKWNALGKSTYVEMDEGEEEYDSSEEEEETDNEEEEEKDKISYYYILNGQNTNYSFVAGRCLIYSVDGSHRLTSDGRTCEYDNEDAFIASVEKCS